MKIIHLVAFGQKPTFVPETFYIYYFFSKKKVRKKVGKVGFWPKKYKKRPNLGLFYWPLLSEKVGRKWAESGLFHKISLKIDIIQYTETANQYKKPSFCPLIKLKVATEKIKVGIKIFVILLKTTFRTSSLRISKRIRTPFL